MPEMIPAYSSNVNSIGYENGVLYVEFNKGATYTYEGVPQTVFDAFVASQSKGQFFRTNIKGQYPFTAIS